MSSWTGKWNYEVEEKIFYTITNAISGEGGICDGDGF